ncbi:uncharacterized protein LOC125257714 [Megalobrama amblycephala]|uniref:uncharacterized protein LOC125257714 n=1 Tax=Megalobrama amblycephala TaxID=75352 RepID=UPI002013F709|nr:uncharacterized protein LOC125257714 [Megalobrama amblycephala]
MDDRKSSSTELNLHLLLVDLTSRWCKRCKCVLTKSRATDRASHSFHSLKRIYINGASDFIPQINAENLKIPSGHTCTVGHTVAASWQQQRYAGHGHHSSNWGCHGDDWTWLKAVVEDDLMQDLLLFQLALQPSPCLSPALRGVDKAFVRGKSVNTGHSACKVCVCQNPSMTNTHSDSNYLSVHFDFPCFLHISWWILLLGCSHICSALFQMRMDFSSGV